MSIEEIFSYATSKYSGVTINKNWGERGLFYNPEFKLTKGIYILTVKEKDGPNDKASNVDRDGIYRLNLGISKTTFISLFQKIPKRSLCG